MVPRMVPGAWRAGRLFGGEADEVEEGGVPALGVEVEQAHGVGAGGGR
jgi:hypothetical protein